MVAAASGIRGPGNRWLKAAPQTKEASQRCQGILAAVGGAKESQRDLHPPANRTDGARVNRHTSFCRNRRGGCTDTRNSHLPLQCATSPGRPWHPGPRHLSSSEDEAGFDPACSPSCFVMLPGCWVNPHLGGVQTPTPSQPGERSPIWLPQGDFCVGICRRQRACLRTQ